MLNRIVLTLLILFFNIFLIKESCQAFDLFGSKFSVNTDNNIVIPSATGSNIHQTDVQDIISKTEQLESKVESDKNSLKAIVDQKKQEYLEAKKNYNYANKQLKTIRSINKNLHNNF